MKYLICLNRVVEEYTDPREAYAAALAVGGNCVIYRGEAQKISVEDLRQEAGLAKLDAERLQFEAERGHELVRSHVEASLVRAGVKPEEQRWSLQVDSSGVDQITLLVVCRVKDIVARRLFGSRKTEAIRSRMTRAAEQGVVSSLGWTLGGTEYEMWRDPVGRMHWITITARLTRPRAEFEQAD